jgi:hypothetical protein
MAKCVAALAYLVGVTAVFAEEKEDWTESCKAGLYNCGCKHGCHQWTSTNPRTPLFETEELCRQGSICWGDLAQFNCPSGKKAEVLDAAFSQAKETGRLVLYLGNTGG